jgi:hypothetical protein
MSFHTCVGLAVIVLFPTASGAPQPAVPTAAPAGNR